MPSAAPSAPAMPASIGGGVEARPAIVATATPPPPELPMDPAHVAVRQQVADQVDSASPDAKMETLRAGAKAAGEGQVVQEGAVAGSTQAAATAENPQATAEQTTPNQPSEETIQQTLTELGLSDTPTNREIAQHLITAQSQREGAAQGDVITEEQRKKQEKEAQKAQIGRVFDVMGEMYKEKPDLVREYCQEWIKRDPEAAKKFAEAGNVYMQELMQKKAFDKAILVGGLLVALWLIWNTLGPGAGGGR